MKKATAALAAALLALGGVALTAAPASAHTGGLTGVAACEPDGTYKVTWTYAATNVPDGVEAETKAMTTTPGTLAPIDGVDKGGQVFLSVWAEHSVNVPGAPTKTGNWTGTFATVGVPGTHVGEITTMVQTDWKGGPSEDPVGRVTVPGDCETPAPKKVVVCKYVGTPGVDERLQTGQNPIEVAKAALGKDWDGTFPAEFADKHGRSIALGYADGTVYTLDDCPAPEEPPVVVVPPKPEPETVVRDEILKDCDADTITRIVWTSTTGEPTYDEKTNTWTQGEYGPEVETSRDVYPATPEDCPVTEPPTEEPPVEEPPVEEPPTEEPPTEEPPVVTPPTEEPPVTEEPEPTPSPSAPPVTTEEEPPTADAPPVLARTGGAIDGIVALTAGALAVALLGLSLTLGIRARTR